MWSLLKINAQVFMASMLKFFCKVRVSPNHFLSEGKALKESDVQWSPQELILQANFPYRVRVQTGSKPSLITKGALIRVFSGKHFAVESCRVAGKTGMWEILNQYFLSWQNMVENSWLTFLFYELWPNALLIHFLGYLSYIYLEI